MNELIQPPHSAWQRPRIDTELLGVCTTLSAVLSVPVFLLRMAFLNGGLLFLLTFVASLSQSFTPLISAAALGMTSSTVLLYLCLWWAIPRQELNLNQTTGINQELRGKPATFQTSQNIESFLSSSAALTIRWVATASLLGTTTTALTISFHSIFLNRSTYLNQYLDPQEIPNIAFALGLLTVGITLGTLPLGTVDNARWSGKLDSLPRPVLLSITLALLTILSGAVILVESFFGLIAMLTTTAIAFGTLGVLALVLVPWVKKLWQSIKAESTQRALMHQQAEIASHLHDSVLQTLTLIGRNSTSETQRLKLARKQEKELRQWLYGNTAAKFIEPELPKELGAAISQTASELENLHQVEIEVIKLGECAITPQNSPLIAAAKEAINNAACHARVGIQVFCDLASSELEIYVRDRGNGFDLQNIPDGRLGVKESIIGRMERAGGSASIYPAIGGGTEVTLSLPNPN